MQIVVLQMEVYRPVELVEAIVSLGQLVFRLLFLYVVLLPQSVSRCVVLAHLLRNVVEATECLLIEGEVGAKMPI